MTLWSPTAVKTSPSEARPGDRLVEPLLQQLEFEDGLLGIDLRYKLSELGGERHGIEHRADQKTRARTHLDRWVKLVGIRAIAHAHTAAYAFHRRTAVS